MGPVHVPCGAEVATRTVLSTHRIGPPPQLSSSFLFPLHTHPILTHHHISPFFPHTHYNTAPAQAIVYRFLRQLQDLDSCRPSAVVSVPAKLAHIETLVKLSWWKSAMASHPDQAFAKYWTAWNKGSESVSTMTNLSSDRAVTTYHVPTQGW